MNITRRQGVLGAIATAMSLGMRIRFVPDVPAENEENVQVWTTADGRKLRIVDMDDDHLRNCISYQAKMFGYRNSGGYGRCPSEQHPLYDVMRREADRRGLAWFYEPRHT